MRTISARKTNKLWWLMMDFDIIGFEGEGDGSSESGDAGDGASGDAGSGGTGDEGTDEGSGTDDAKDEGKDGEDTAGLKSALQKERKLKKDAERELKKLRDAQEERDLADKSEVDQAKIKADKATATTAKLAEKLMTRSLDSAILKAASDMKFRDTDDALSLIDRSSITVEQDEEDPAEIDIDTKSVEKAVKALAAKKPHLLIADGDEHASGGKFGGHKNKDEADEAALRKRYSALDR